MKKLSYFIPVILLSLLFQSCYYDELPEENGILPTDVSFSQDVQPIFNVNCVSCHPGILQPDLTSGNSFNNLINGNYVIPLDAANSQLINNLLGINGEALMPPSGSLNQSDVDKISQWIDEGALDN